MPIYTKHQMLTFLYSWGYTAGTLPRDNGAMSVLPKEAIVSIGRAVRFQTRACITIEGKDRAGRTLYGLRIIP